MQSIVDKNTEYYFNCFFLIYAHKSQIWIFLI